MPLDYDPQHYENLKARISSVFSDIIPDLELVGRLAAEAIVRTTLAGIGEGDQPFVKYSAAYQALIDAVGGKPQQTVNLRGLFYHKGQKRVRFRSEKRRLQFREGRQAFIGVHFALSRRAQRQTRAYNKAGGRSLASLLAKAVSRVQPRTKSAKGLAVFTGRTGITRPAKGVTDPLSEMSLDLITVVAQTDLLKIIYKARQKGYMVVHNKGEGKMPLRKWFSLDKAAVKGAIIKGMELILKARILRTQLDAVPAGPVGPAVEGVIRQTLDLPGGE